MQGCDLYAQWNNRTCAQCGLYDPTDAEYVVQGIDLN